MKARTTYLKLLSANTMALLVVMVAGYLMSEPASAQRDAPPPSDPVLAAVQELQRTIVGLQVNVDALQASLDAHIAPSHFRWTPAVRASNDSATCMVVNVSDVEKTIHIEVKVRDGSTQRDAMVNVAPGAQVLSLSRLAASIFTASSRSSMARGPTFAGRSWGSVPAGIVSRSQPSRNL